MNQSQPNDATRPKTAIILCRVLEQEIEHFAAETDQIVRVVSLEQGLHNEPNKLRESVQASVDQIEQETDAEVIVLGYGSAAALLDLLQHFTDLFGNHGIPQSILGV